jgi:hypothetical protein
MFLYFWLATRTNRIIRCGIDAEYFPARSKSPVSTLSEEDVEVLAALQDLASQDAIKPMLLGRTVWI